MAKTEFKAGSNNVLGGPNPILTVNGVTLRTTSGIPLAATGANGDLHIDTGAGTSPGYRPALLQRQSGAYRGIAG